MSGTPDRSNCRHEAWAFVGVDGRASFYRCTACGEVFVQQGGSTWHIRPGTRSA